MVAGAIAPTRRVIEAASMVIGLEEGHPNPVQLFPDGSSGWGKSLSFPTAR